MSMRMGQPKYWPKGQPMRNTKIVCLVVMTFVVQGSGVACRQEQQPACKEFFAQSIEQQETLFPTLPLERQLEIFRCGMYRRPPEIALAYDIAKGGEKIVPALT